MVFLRIVFLQEVRMLKSIIDAFQRGWLSGGIPWREEFVDKNLNPDAFLQLPNANELLQQYSSLNPQGKVIFLNTIYRQFPFLRK